MLNSIIAFFAVGASQKVILYIILASFLDIFMGLVKAGVGKRFNSTISSAGIIKHVTQIVVPILVYPLFMIIDGGLAYWTMFTGLILVTMVVSVAENWCAIGLPFPPAIKQFLDDAKTAIVSPQGTNKKKE